ncbi:hypothetical protein J4427_03335 [Candidatus Woesearchaeota archaeon]|nr:hypothetical protein [Candidatus Woesearchaeota archaeon]
MTVEIGKVVNIKPNGRKEKRILVDLLNSLGTEKPCTMGELEAQMSLLMKKENAHPNMLREYQALYELLLGLAAGRDLVRIEYFCGKECRYIAGCPSKTTENPCYRLTPNGVEYLEKRKAGHA